MMMLGVWIVDILKGFGMMFIQPLFYWVIFLLFIMGWRRVKQERRQFGRKIYTLFSEARGTLVLSIVFSIILSLLTIFVGIVVSLEIIVVLTIVMIVVSLTGRTHYLSASYTLGITFLMVTLLPYVNLGTIGNYLNFERVTIVQLLSLGFIMVVMLFLEALLMSNKKGLSFPEMKLGARGKWIGQHRIKRVALIPFFILLPVGHADLTLPLFPYFEVSGNGYQLVFLPFIIGVDYIVRSLLPVVAAKRIGRRTWILAVISLFLMMTSLYYPFFSIIAFFIAIIGKEWITYQHKKKDKETAAIFTPIDEGLKVLAILPNTPGDRLDIQIGETIVKVNGHAVNNSSDYYDALQNSGAYFKLDVLNNQGEIRFVSGAFYEEDHYELGLVFVREPSR